MQSVFAVLAMAPCDWQKGVFVASDIYVPGAPFADWFTFSDM